MHTMITSGRSVGLSASAASQPPAASGQRIIIVSAISPVRGTHAPIHPLEALVQRVCVASHHLRVELALGGDGEHVHVVHAGFVGRDPVEPRLGANRL